MQIIFYDQAESVLHSPDSVVNVNKFDISLSIKKLNLDIFSRKNLNKWTEIGCLTLKNLDLQLHIDETKKHIQFKVDNLQ